LEFSKGASFVQRQRLFLKPKVVHN
jgi:hypothetical protein